MKKTYISPSLHSVQVELRSHLMDLSAFGSYSISDSEASTDAFVKSATSSNSRGYNVWDDDWSGE